MPLHDRCLFDILGNMHIYFTFVFEYIRSEWKMEKQTCDHEQVSQNRACRCMLVKHRDVLGATSVACMFDVQPSRFK